ncbi:OsmC family protein [Paracoccus sp. MC1862]|uniref:OsmC family protein n=1 Tax=Paracoccus sp. MC1862 TaxID=2760307 RepID=UPI00190B8D07|nr:OsmC family protein [Paracoccus sp. MC1862]QQO44099.1 OsmC family protein [Paracoccus sp. MC1862]
MWWTGPRGRPGGLGLGFNGAQLLAVAIRGCFCNDLHHVAHRRGAGIGSISVEVALVLDGDPLIATRADMTVRCSMADGSDPAPVIEKAKRSSMVGISLPRGIPASVAMGS